MTKRALLTVAALLALSVTARGQSQSLASPFDYPPILSTTPQQVLSIDPIRRRIIFFNPSAKATIAFCPSEPATNRQG